MPLSASVYYAAAQNAQAVQDVQPYNGIGTTHAIRNPVVPKIYARACNRLVAYPESTTSDDEVTRIKRLPIDIAPFRPSNVPSSTPELHAARANHDKVLDHLEYLPSLAIASAGCPAIAPTSSSASA